MFDEHDNLAGGVRSPLVDVPIARYFAGGAVTPSADPCGIAGGAAVLLGTTRVFDAAKLAELYPTPDAYLRKFDASVRAAVEAGSLLREDVPEIRRRACATAKWLSTAG